MSEQHEIKVQIEVGRLGKFDATFRATCACGWASPDARWVRILADRDGTKHVAQRVSGGAR